MHALPSLAVVGCGAATTNYYAPAIADREAAIGDLVFVDLDVGRAESVANRIGRGRVTTEYEDVLEEVDGAIIAVPHEYHYPIAEAFIRSKTDVLVEKPLTETGHEAADLVDLAGRYDVHLAVDNTRRLFPSVTAVRSALEHGQIGTLEEVSIEEGAAFDWNSASEFRFTNTTNGVLMDIGAHVLDILCYWLGERPTLEWYRDDSFGGPEATATLSVRSSTGVNGIVKLSWLSDLHNVYELHGSEGTITVEPYGWHEIQIERPEGTNTISLGGRGRTFASFVADVFENFLEVVRGRAEPLVPGGSVVDSIHLIEECYRCREPFAMPWMEPSR